MEVLNVCDTMHMACIYRRIHCMNINRTRVVTPERTLASCVRAFVVRDTVGQNLGRIDRLSYFPAVPTVAITWFIKGEISWVRNLREQQEIQLSDNLVFSGPFTEPTLTYNPGEVRGIICMFFPDAFYRLTGVSPADWVNKVVPVGDVLNKEWCDFTSEILHAECDESAIGMVHSFLEPRWEQFRSGKKYSFRYEDWVNSLGLRLYQSGVGRSIRQFERRVKKNTGLPIRELKNIARAEKLFFNAREGRELNWSDVSHESGYSDQPHMSRSVRKASGFSPARLRKLVNSEEAFWPYRIWQ